jgi:hypothetical protein
MAAMMSEATDGDIVQTVGFLGVTHTGKSTLIKSCLGIELSDDKYVYMRKLPLYGKLVNNIYRNGPKIAALRSKTPTTGNVLLFKHQDKGIQYLDVEGMSYPALMRIHLLLCTI